MLRKLIPSASRTGNLLKNNTVRSMGGHAPEVLKSFIMPERAQGYGTNFPLLSEECWFTLEWTLPTPIPHHTFDEVPTRFVCTDERTLVTQMNYNMELRERIFNAIKNNKSDEEIAAALKANGMEHEAKDLEFYKENFDLLEQDFYDEWEALTEMCSNQDH